MVISMTTEVTMTIVGVAICQAEDEMEFTKEMNGSFVVIVNIVVTNVFTFLESSNFRGGTPFDNSIGT